MCKSVSIAMLFTFLGLVCYAQDITELLTAKTYANQSMMEWDTLLFTKDLEKSPNSSVGPFTVLAFPVQRYKYAVFSKPFQFDAYGHTFFGISFGENSNDIFSYGFTVIFYINDQIPDVNSLVMSRNAPYLTAQGELDIRTNKFQFFGIKSPDHMGFVTVNLKTFDLRFGETIIIFPYKDNSFVYLQLSHSPATIEGMENFIEDQLVTYVESVKSEGKIKEMINYIENK